IVEEPQHDAFDGGKLIGIGLEIAADIAARQGTRRFRAIVCGRTLQPSKKIANDHHCEPHRVEGRSLIPMLGRASLTNPLPMKISEFRQAAMGGHGCGWRAAKPHGKRLFGPVATARGGRLMHSRSLTGVVHVTEDERQFGKLGKPKTATPKGGIQWRSSRRPPGTSAAASISRISYPANSSSTAIPGPSRKWTTCCFPI